MSSSAGGLDILMLQLQVTSVDKGFDGQHVAVGRQGRQPRDNYQHNSGTSVTEFSNWRAAAAVEINWIGLIASAALNQCQRQNFF